MHAERVYKISRIYHNRNTETYTHIHTFTYTHTQIETHTHTHNITYTADIHITKVTQLQNITVLALVSLQTVLRYV